MYIGFAGGEKTPDMRRLLSQNKVPHIHFRASVNLSFDIVIFVTVLWFLYDMFAFLFAATFTA